MTVRRTLTVARLHARDLGRRRLALAILVLLPLVFYFSFELQPTDPDLERAFAGDPERLAAAELWIVATASVGAGWAVAVAALFVIIGARRLDQSLLIAGYRPTELLAGRVVTVLALAAVITPVFGLVIWSQREIRLGALLGSIALALLIAVAIGVVAAALVPREMEGVLVIIGVVGVQMSGDPQNWMPLWGSAQLLQRAVDLSGAAVPGVAVAHTFMFTVALLALGTVLWARQIRLQPPARSAATDPDSAGAVAERRPA
jgi:hypothetical protein